jgi:hypothetical protein
MTQNYDLAAWFIHRLTGSVDTVIDWRCIHDKDKARPAHNYRGNLAYIWPTLEQYSRDGYGIFCVINAMDGQGRELGNVAHIRAQFVDLDNTLTAAANYQRAVESGAQFAVQSSPGKYHIYWKVEPYVSNDFFTLIQRKLIQLYDGDKTIIDATRVMRVPGFVHQKGDPFTVTGWELPAIARVRTAQEFETELAAVNVIEFYNTRSPLGEPTMAAPSLDWLKFALSLVDPNDMDRGDWLSFSAAFKQAGWNHADDATLFNIWSEWCARYTGNDPGENVKLWESVKDTEVGWTSIERRSPVKAYMMFGFKDAPPTKTPPAVVTDAASLLKPAAVDTGGEILSEYECQEWFKDCFFVERTGQIFSRAGRFMNSTQFNGRYGGKQFIITSTGKITDEAWKAALRSTCWTIPKVDHVRFLPDRPTFEIVEDALGRRGLNTYIPAKINAVKGDVTIWLEHVAKILPVESDRKLLFDYMAHCVKFPGFKIPWAPLLQSAEGIGKTVFFEVMQYALGDMYVYSPKAPELVKSGSTFNAWQRGKLLIVVNEIKIDERRELIEILKPMITDARIEVQSKGVDQDMEDNTANWLLFSNYKDAVPINLNGRRYSINYSALQSKADIINAGMDEAYFNRIWAWLRDGGGLQAVAHWLLNYPIERGGVPVRAPETSSHAEAISISRSPMEVIIADCIADGIQGFRGGYVSTLAVIIKCRAAGIRSPNTRTVQTCLENMGFVRLGRAVRSYMQEDLTARSELYGVLSNMPVDGYGRAQGYE